MTPPVAAPPLQRILVVLPNWFGETLFVTPFLRALRRQRPDAHVAAMGWPQCREILLENPHLNEFVPYEERGAHRGLFGKWRIVRALRARRFDTAFILRKSLSRSWLLRLAGIPARVGFDNPKSGRLLTHRVPGPDETVHKAASYLALLPAVGLVSQSGRYEFHVAKAEQEAAHRLLAQYRLRADHPLVVIHPGANWDHKRWPAERFAALGDALAQRHRAQVLITGGPDDAALANRVARGMREPAIVLAGQTTLRQLGACIEQASLLVSNDTGVLHMGAALGRPLVALYGPTDPLRTGPLGDPRTTTVLHHAACCPRVPCYAPDHPEHPGMKAISVDEACGAAAALLERAGGGAPPAAPPTDTDHA